MKHKPVIHLCNRKNRVALVMVTGTWLFTPMTEGVTLTGVQTAFAPKVELDTSVKPEPATGQFSVNDPLPWETASETLVVSGTSGPTVCAAVMAAGSSCPA